MNDHTGPTSPNQGEDLQKTYSEAISRTLTLLISATIIVLILIVVVGQELREHDKKQKELQGDIDTAQGELKQINKKLDCTYLAIDKTINADIRELSQVDPRDIPQPRPSGRIDYDSDIETLVREEQEIKTVVGKLSSTLKEEKVKKTSSELKSTGTKKRVAELEEATPADYRKDCPPFSLPVVDIGKTLSQREKATITVRTLDIALGLVNNYKDLYHEEVAPAQRLLNKTNESKELNSSKKSIPTLFGNFEVAPKLALLGLAFAVLVGYFAFSLSLRRINKLAIKYNKTHPGKKISSGDPAPFWLYCNAPLGEEATLEENNPNYPRALPLHFFWLGVSGWLVAEVVTTWGAAKALAFEYNVIWDYILVACLVTALVLGIWTFSTVKFRQRLARLWNSTTKHLTKASLFSVYSKHRQMKLSRRAFLYVGIATVLALATRRTLVLLSGPPKNTVKDHVRAKEITDRLSSSDCGLAQEEQSTPSCN